MTRRLVLALAALLVFTAGHAAGQQQRADSAGYPTGADEDFRPLFDGETFEGWQKSGGGRWAIEEGGVIVGRHDSSDARYGLLTSDAVYRDFTARLEFKVTQGNSGFYFRSRRSSGVGGIEGIQAEVDTSSAVAGLYESGGRGWVVKPTPAPDTLAGYFDPHGWNQLTVRARGDSVTTWLNGHRVADLDGNAGFRQGRFALQLHGGQDMLVRFRNLQVKGEPLAQR